jgi:hypothetical protein
MSWNAHVDATVKKANNSLSFLRRNLTRCPQDIKAQCYKSLVRPILEYASAAWDPYTTKNIQQLEAVQRRAARFVTGDYKTTSSTSNMIKALGWEPLQERRKHTRTVMMYRIIYGLVDITATTYLHPSSLSTRHTLRGTWFLTAGQTSIDSPSFQPASAIGTASQSMLPQPRLWKPSSRGWLPLTSYV